MIGVRSLPLLKCKFDIPLQLCTHILCPPNPVGNTSQCLLFIQEETERAANLTKWSPEGPCLTLSNLCLALPSYLNRRCPICVRSLFSCSNERNFSRSFKGLKRELFWEHGSCTWLPRSTSCKVLIPKATPSFLGTLCK
jgi:hypothetical protein